ncbi:MAG: ABC transporter permease [Solirubrobacteraceae bacterium]
MSDSQTTLGTSGSVGASVVSGGAQAPGAGKASWMGVLRRLSLGRYTGVLVALLVVFVYLSVTQSAFLTWSNMRNIIGANTVIFALAMGATFVVITGGIDLSVASLMTAVGMIFAITVLNGVNVWAAILIAFAFGSAAGLANGLLISKVKISFLAVTLGALSIWQSFALVVYNGETVAIFGVKDFGVVRDFVNNGIGPIPLLLIFDVILLLVAGGILRYTRFGRALFAIGSNEEAARLSGINVGRVLIGVYALAGLAAGLGCIVAVGRLTAGSPTVEPTLLLTVLAAVLIGGTSFTGGIGGVFGTAIGVIFLGVVQNGLVLSNVSSYWQGIVSGAILIVAVGLGVFRERGWTLAQLRSARAAGTEAPIR